MTNPLSNSIRRFALLSLLAAFLTACAPSFNADVSRFTSKLPAPQGQTFAVVADDPELAGGLEFAMYADMVADELEKLGYTEAASPSEATMLVRFEYKVGEGREVVRTTGSTFYDPYYGLWRPYYGFRRGYAFGFYDPFLAAPEVRSYTVYPSEIEIEIDSTQTGERLFEGRAQAVSRTNRLQVLIPNLIDAFFTDFPGNSGETVRITIKEDGKTVRPVR